MAEQFVYLTEYLVTENVPMTNNVAEGYFQRTYPKRIKRRFRTPEGAQAQITCLGVSRGGVPTDNDDAPRNVHESLSNIYRAFATLLAQV